MMLDRFKVPAKDQVLVSETELRRTVTQIFEKLGVSAEDAADAADALTMTDLRGVETHGVSNMLRAYVRDYRTGKLDPRPGWRIVRESPGTAVIDAERRLGIIIGPKAMRLAVRLGSPLLPGWVSDKEGNPITEEKPVFDRDEYYQLPLGGTREQGSHKGYGFALMAEVLSTVLAGALPTMLAAGGGSENHFAAYDIAAFTDVEHFKDTMDRMLGTLRTATPAPGQERVLYPGLSEFEETQQRRAKGIPLHKEVLQWFGECTREMGVAPLSP